jgi:hypothetical protein
VAFALAGLAVAATGRTAHAAAASPFSLIPPDARDRLASVPATAPKGASPAVAATAQMAAYAIRNARSWNTRDPHAMAAVKTEGTLPHQGIYDQSVEAERDWTAALELALGDRLKGETALAQRSVAFISAWLAVYKSNLNPIDETNLDQFMLAYDLLSEAERSPIADGWAKYLRTFAAAYLDSMPTIKGGTATNNWQSHRVKLATLAAFGSGDQTLIDRSRAAYRKQLADNLKPDGSTIDFTERNAIDYVTYDLQPLLTAALAGKTHGQDWYADMNAANVGLRQALLWLQPYADGSKTHDEFVHSTVEFDRTRAAAGLPGFAGPWKPQGAETVFTLAARLDADFAVLAASLNPGFAGSARPRMPWLHLALPV